MFVSGFFFYLILATDVSSLINKLYTTVKDSQWRLESSLRSVTDRFRVTLRPQSQIETETETDNAQLELTR